MNILPPYSRHPTPPPTYVRRTPLISFIPSLTRTSLSLSDDVSITGYSLPDADGEPLDCSDFANFCSPLRIIGAFCARLRFW